MKLRGLYQFVCADFFENATKTFRPECQINNNVEDSLKVNILSSIYDGGTECHKNWRLRNYFLGIWNRLPKKSQE